MKLRDMITAAREYPKALAELEQTRTTVRECWRECADLRQQNARLHSDLHVEISKADLCLAALREVLPCQTETQYKSLYELLAPAIDKDGFRLYHAAKAITGICVPSAFSYEDNRGLFEEASGHELMKYLLAARFHAVAWDVVPGTTYEKATLLDVDTSTAEYRAFEAEVYGKVLRDMGFGELLPPETPAKNAMKRREQVER